MASILLKRKLRNYSKRLYSHYIHSNKVPSTVIGAEHKNLRKVDHSGNVPDPLAPKLERELVKIAPLGTKGYDNYVGCCCEVRSSNQIILTRQSVKIKNIVFTDAIRTRTGQIIRRCHNCKAVFG